MHNSDQIAKPRIAGLISKFTIAEIKSLFKSSKSVFRHPGLDISRSNSLSQFARVLIITPRKMGNSPFRNLIKRRIRSIFYQEELFKDGKDIIIFCKKDIGQLSYNDLKKYIIGSIRD